MVQQLGADLEFLEANSPHSPAQRIALSTTHASNQTASMSEDGAAQDGVRAQTPAHLHAGKMDSYQPKSRRAPPCQEPLTLAAGRLMQPFSVDFLTLFL